MAEQSLQVNSFPDFAGHCFGLRSSEQAQRSPVSTDSRRIRPVLPFLPFLPFFPLAVTPPRAKASPDTAAAAPAANPRKASLRVSPVVHKRLTKPSNFSPSIVLWVPPEEPTASMRGAASVTSLQVRKRNPRGHIAMIWMPTPGDRLGVDAPRVGSSSGGWGGSIARSPHPSSHMRTCRGGGPWQYGCITTSRDLWVSRRD